MFSSKPFRTVLALALISVTLLVNAQDKNPPTDSLQDFLVASSAADFIAHERTRPAKVKRVHLRYTENDSGERTYMLCGQFQPTIRTAKREWTDFVTLKTRGYEQWIGAQATVICKNARTLRGVPDLSKALQSKLLNVPPAEE